MNPKAKTLVSRYLAETPWAYSAADVINGCVSDTLRGAFDCLEDELDGSVPEADEQFYDGAWGYAEEHICAAHQERVGGPALRFPKHGYIAFRPAGQVRRGTDAASVPEADNALALRRDEPMPATDDGCQHFTFNYPPKAKVCGLRIGIALNTDQMARAQSLAAEFGLEVRAFLKKLVGRNLPGQPSPARRLGAKRLGEQIEGEHIGFTCLDAAMSERIARAAQAKGVSVGVDDFVASAIGSEVDSYEETMIVHPQTGELLCEDVDDVFTRVSHDVTAPPKSGSHINLLSGPQRKAEPTRETKPPQVNGEHQAPAKPVFMLNAPRLKLPRKPKE